MAFRSGFQIRGGRHRRRCPLRPEEAGLFGPAGPPSILAGFLDIPVLT